MNAAIRLMATCSMNAASTPPPDPHRRLIIHSGQDRTASTGRPRPRGQGCRHSNLLAPPPNTPSSWNDIAAGRRWPECLRMCSIAQADRNARPRSLRRNRARPRLLIGGASAAAAHAVTPAGFLMHRRAGGLVCREVPGSGRFLKIRAARSQESSVAIIAFYDDVADTPPVRSHRARPKQTLLYGVDLGDPEIEEMESHDFWRHRSRSTRTRQRRRTRSLAAALRSPMDGAATLPHRN
jgi:hypothetical protein